MNNTAGENGLVIKDGVLIGYTGNEDVKEIMIPDGVTEIADRALISLLSLSRIVFPEGLKRIGNESFAHCRALKSIELPSTVQSIGEKAFFDCFLMKKAIMQDGVEEIGANAFGQCAFLKEIRLSNLIKAIPEGLFRGCFELTELIMPREATVIGREACSHCYRLSRIEVGDKVERIGENAFHGCSKLETVRLGRAVRSIGYGAFERCHLLRSIMLSSVLTLDALLLKKHKLYALEGFLTELADGKAMDEKLFAAFEELAKAEYKLSKYCSDNVKLGYYLALRGLLPKEDAQYLTEKTDNVRIKAVLLEYGKKSSGTVHRENALDAEAEEVFGEF